MDYGFVGDIDRHRHHGASRKLLDNGLMPVVSPLSADDNGTLLNINADTVAAAIGAALRPRSSSCAPARRASSSASTIPARSSRTPTSRASKRLREEKRIVDGMLPKAKAIEDAIRGGVRRVHVMSYKSPEGILAEVFTNEGTGTLIVADVNALSPAEQQSRQVGSA